MASSNASMGVPLIAGAAFTAADFGKLVKISAARTVTLVSALTDTVAGVLAQAPAASGESVTIAQLQGIIKVQAGATITVGHILIPATDGQVTGVATIDALGANIMGIGIALEGGADGEIIEALAMPLTSAASA